MKSRRNELIYFIHMHIACIAECMYQISVTPLGIYVARNLYLTIIKATMSINRTIRLVMTTLPLYPHS